LSQYLLSCLTSYFAKAISEKFKIHLWKKSPVSSTPEVATWKSKYWW
jgi:hypothetical protein